MPPSTGLDGPFKLSEEVIDEVVKCEKACTYVLGHSDKKGFYPKYVGRSDTDCKGRLKKWVGKYEQFKFKCYDAVKKAFEKECNIYHDWLKQLDNEIHPDRPDGKDWKCPRCDKFG